MDAGGRSRWRRDAPDLLIGVLLLVMGLLVRGDGMPTDGLWLDDAIVGAGLSPPPSDLLAVSFDHPGYTVLMSAWSGLTGGGDTALTLPALIAGALGAPLLFLALRGLGYARAISLLVGAALVGAQAHVTYSGRLKTYTIDLLIVLAIALVLPRIAKLTWSWRTGAAWIAGALLVSAFSSFALVATMVAGAIVVLTPASDLRVRLAAVGAQAVATIGLLLLELRTYDSDPIEEQWRELWDAFPDLGADVLEHLRRLGEMFPGGPAWLGGLSIAVALAGLAGMAWRGRDAIRARYLLLLLAAALVGGLLGKFPFGPQAGNPLSTGERASLWLIPVIAIGLIFALQALRDALADRRGMRIGFDALAYAGAAVLLIAAGPAQSYPFPGPQSAAEYVDAELGPEDSLLLPFRSNWSFAYESSSESEPRATPDSSIGFVPEFADERVHDVDSYVDGPAVDSGVEGADRVFVYYPAQPFSAEEAATREQLAGYLLDRGFASEVATFENATVEVWSRNEGNMTASDVPADWRVLPTPGSSTLYECLGIATEDATRTAVAALSPDPEGQVILVSEMTRWPTTEAGEEAAAALNGPESTGCVSSAFESNVELLDLPLGVDARPIPPPSTAGLPAQAFELTTRTPEGASIFATGTVVVINNVRTTSLISALSLSEDPFPPALLSRVVEAVATRMDRATASSR